MYKINIKRTGDISVARGGGGGCGGTIALPPLVCQPKYRIKKYHVFSSSETVFCAGMD